MSSSAGDIHARDDSIDEHRRPRLAHFSFPLQPSAKGPTCPALNTSHLPSPARQDHLEHGMTRVREFKTSEDST
nr:hypothetical protein CFP56_03795 [Quercus suber]